MFKRPEVVGAILFALLFLLVTGQVAMDGPLVRYDHRFNSVAAELRTPDWLPAAAWLKHLANTTSLIAFAVFASALLWRRFRWREIAALWLTLAGVLASIVAGKALVERARPEALTGFAETSFSFPSGTAAIAMAQFGLLALFLARPVKSSALRRVIWLFAGLVILVIGASRLYLGVHWLSDVLAGFLVGGFWILVGLVILPQRRQ